MRFFLLKWINLFYLEGNYFTISWWFSPYISMNQPQMHTCPPHPEPLSHLPPHPIPLGCPRAPALGALLHALNRARFWSWKRKEMKFFLPQMLDEPCWCMTASHLSFFLPSFLFCQVDCSLVLWCYSTVLGHRRKKRLELSWLREWSLCKNIWRRKWEQLLLRRVDRGEGGIREFCAL